jgi:thioredoxin
MGTFKHDVLDTSKNIPVLVQFTAEWCGPCKMIKPVMRSVSESRDDYRFYLLNVDNDRETAIKYSIRSIPRIILFHEGNAVADYRFGASSAKLNMWLDDILGQIEEHKQKIVNSN